MSSEIGTAFDPANFGPVVIIQLNRIYDAMMALLGSANPGAADALNILHSQGKTLSPPPSFMTDGTEVTDK